MRKLDESEKGSVYFSSKPRVKKKWKSELIFENLVRNAMREKREIGFKGCWVWQGRLTKTGYGVLWFAGRAFWVHRLAYELDKGPITDGLFVLHSCDNPGCFNPAHLFLGTPKENVEDMMAKSRDRFFGRTKSGLQLKRMKREAKSQGENQ